MDTINIAVIEEVKFFYLMLVKTVHFENNTEYVIIYIQLREKQNN